MRFTILLLLFLVCSLSAISQFSDNERSKLIDSLQNRAERNNKAMCYIQSSKGIYETGEELWFKAYLLDNQLLLPDTTNKILYVQLLRAGTGAPVWQEIYPIENGVSKGRIYLYDSLPEGDYTLEAYSSHSFFNDSSDFHAVRKIKIKKNIIPQIKMDAVFGKPQYKAGDSVRLQVRLPQAQLDKQFYALTAEYLQGNKVVESIDNNVAVGFETIFSFTPKDTVAGAIIRLKCLEKKSKKEAMIVLPVPYTVKGKIQFSLFPEGGYLVAGLRNSLAFKAVDEAGNPVSVSGTLYENGTALFPFKSEHAGMGSFYFNPASGKKYTIRIQDPLIDSTYEIRDIKNTGILLHLVKTDKDSILCKVTKSTSLPTQRIYLRSQVRGSISALAKAVLRDSLLVKLPADSMQGVAELTLFDSAIDPIAERLVYVNAAQKIYLQTQVLDSNYQPGGKVVIKLKATDEQGLPVKANLGLSVYDYLYSNTEDAKNIFTDCYLSTVLKGRIYDPLYYFKEENSNRARALDLLLLTQGWRRYVWNEEQLNTRKNQPVIFDEISGAIKYPRQHKRNAKDNRALLFTPSNDQYKKLITTDSSGVFIVKPEDFFMASGGYVYVKALAGENTKVLLSMNSPFTSIAHIRKQQRDVYPIAKYVQTNQYRNIPDSVAFNRGATLPDIVVKTVTRSQFRDKYIALLDSLEKYNSATPDFINVPDSDSATYKTNDRHYFLNDFLAPLSNRRKPIEGKTYRVLMRKGQLLSHGDMIREKSGKLAFPFDKEELVVYHYPKYTEEELMEKNHLARVRGYYRSKEFYQPDYDKSGSQTDLSSDYRNTLLWEPSLITDEKGEATVSFFCSSIISRFLVCFEGENGKGLLGAGNFEFEVARKKESR